MFTQCTHCSTWFAITAEHLRQGHGEVLCGSCMRSFDALLNLRDALPGDLNGEAALERHLPAEGLASRTDDWGSELDADASRTSMAPTTETGQPTLRTNSPGSEDAPEKDSVPRSEDGNQEYAEPAGTLLGETTSPDSAEGEGTEKASDEADVPPLERYFASDDMDLDEAFATTSPTSDPLAVEDIDAPENQGFAPDHVALEDGNPELGTLRPSPTVGPQIGDIGSLKGGASGIAVRVEPKLEGLDATADLDASSDLHANAPGPETSDEANSAGTVDTPQENSQGTSDASNDESDDKNAAPSFSQALPEVLQADYERIDRALRLRRRRRIYVAAALLCVLSLLAQYAWFLPGDLTARYPIARPWVEHFCAQAGCTLPLERAPQLVSLAHRDVRVHPKYEGALHVSATLVNKAPFSQPFPTIVFTLYNVSGQTIASRRFAPAQYLDREVADAPAMMPPLEPVKVVFELLAPEEAAVSFEFRFI